MERIKYRGNRNPDTITLDDFFKEPSRGANCQTTASGLLTALGYDVPHLRSLELTLDTEHTITVDSLDDLIPHDIIIYQARDGRTDRRYSHPTIALPEGGTLYLAHNPRERGHALIEQALPENHGRIVTIKRPLVRPSPVDVEFLQRTGFEPLMEAA